MRTARVAALILLVLAAGRLAPPLLAADPAPTVASVVPDRGVVTGGYDVVITGTNFTTPLAVTFGGLLSPSVVIDSPTQITVEVPPHAAGPVDVVVTQTTPPPSPSAPATFTYEEVPCRAWVPRAPGSATGGNPGGLDVTVVDVANRRVDASLDLNPADALLPTDDDWRVTQVLFSADGAWAFLATAGVPGTSDSRRIFVVKTARLLGTEEGDPVAASMDTEGNPYQLALSADGKTLFAADGGSWKGSSTLLPNGTFRVFNVTDPAAPVAVGTPTTTGILPVLAWDSTAYRKWGTNSSFTGQIQARNSKTTVTNVGSHTISTIDLPTRTVAGTETAAVDGGGPIQLSVSLPSPFSADYLLVETTDVLSQATSYFIQRLEQADLVAKGPVSQAVSFFPVLPFPDLQNRTAWPHPDGESLVALPATGAKVVAWNPANGNVSGSATVPGGGPPSCLALNDVSGLFYARRDTGGWTVLSASTTKGAAPVAVAQVEDATGIDSLRVVGDGTEMAGTATSSLAILDAVSASPTAHKVAATVALPLDPAGGALFPQPGAACPPARTFVTVAPPGPGPRLPHPHPAPGVCVAEEPPEFEVVPGTGGEDLVLELELGSEPDFLKVPGSVRLRVRVDAETLRAVPPRGIWRRVLRASAGAFSNPFWARVNEVLSDGTRVYGKTVELAVCPPEPPVRISPTTPVDADPEAPPELVFAAAGPGRYWIELYGPVGGYLGRFRVAVEDEEEVAVTVPRTVWRRAARKAVQEAHSQVGQVFIPETVSWKVVFRDLLGREIDSVDE